MFVFPLSSVPVNTNPRNVSVVKVSLILPDERLRDGEDGPDKPRRMQDDERFQILPEPSVDHLVAFLQPAEAGHSPVGGGAVQVHDHVVLRHHQLQRADHIPGRGRGSIFRLDVEISSDGRLAADVSPPV